MSGASRALELANVIAADIKILLARNPVKILDATTAQATKDAFYAAQPAGTIVHEYIP